MISRVRGRTLVQGIKKYIKRILFWGVILAAPVVFIMMGLVYLNAYLTGDRVNTAAIPVLETISGRAVQIGSTGAHIGLTASFDFRSIDFFQKSAFLDPSYSHVDSHIGRLFIQFKPLTLFAQSFQVDSILIDKFQGVVKYDPGRSYTQFKWIDEDESHRMEINLNESDLENIHIKSFRVKNSNIHYINEELQEEYIIDDFYKDVEVEGIRVMNMLLINGSIEGTFRNPETNSLYSRFSVAGRLQINLKDRTFVLRGGRLAIDDDVFSYTAIVNIDDEGARLTVLFEEPRQYVERAFRNLPPSLERWLQGQLPGSRYRVHINYSGEHAEDQT